MNKKTLVNLSWRMKAGLILIALLAVMKFCLIPLYGWQEVTIQKIKTLQKVVSQKKSLIGRGDEIEAVFIKAKTALKEAVGFYEEVYSDAQSLQLSLQKEVEAFSSASGVTIKSTDWLSSSEGKLVQVSIRVKCEASPDQFVKFLSRIETGKRFKELDTLIISSHEKKSIIKATFDISTYGIRKVKSGGHDSI